jgi:LPS export ABC transporter protein LptC
MRFSPLLLLLLGLIACNEAPKVLPSTVKQTTNGVIGSDKPSQVSYNTSMNFTSDGRLNAILNAGRVEQYDLKHITWLDSGVKVDFYNRDGRHSSRLTSDKALIEFTTNNMTAYGHVHIVSDSGTIVDTDSLEWHNKEATLHSNSPVHIVEKNGRTTDGVGFESDQNLEHYKIMHPVIMTPSEGFQGQQRRPGNSMQPPTTVVPGAGAFGNQPKVIMPDSTKR